MPSFFSSSISSFCSLIHTHTHTHTPTSVRLLRLQRWERTSETLTWKSPRWSFYSAPPRWSCSCASTGDTSREPPPSSTPAEKHTVSHTETNLLSETHTHKMSWKLSAYLQKSSRLTSISTSTITGCCDWLALVLGAESAASAFWEGLAPPLRTEGFSEGHKHESKPHHIH